MNDALILSGGVVCAAFGGELFVRGVVGVARWARVSAGIIGATLAAFATSSPELSVAINSALNHSPQISLGDALGSNVVNLGLILGIVLLISPVQAPRASIRRDFTVALLVPFLLAVLAYDGVLSRIDGMLLMALFVGWMVIVVLEVRRQRSVAAQVLGESKHGLAIFYCLGGLLLLVASGKLIVVGATGIALAFGVDEFVIGATLVAIGTSAPELATALIAKLRGHDEVGVGTLLGSNIFNGLMIVSTAAMIYPIQISRTEVGFGLLFGILTMVAIFPGKSGLLRRERGLLLLTLYMAYLGLIFQG